MTVEEALLIVERILEQGRLNKVQEIVFRQAWEGRSYQEIAESSCYDPGYIRDAGSKLWQLLSKAFGEKVTKNNLQSVLKRYVRTFLASESQQIQAVTPNLMAASSIGANKYQDWGDAVDVSVFYGRTEELTTLKRWVVDDCCRVVTVFGMGGIGKTALSVKLAEQIQGEFEYLIWRSLLPAPPILDLLADLIQFLSKGQETNLSETVDARISQLMNYIRQHRCLLVLDNGESILRSGDRTGSYREGYEGYGQLFRCVADTPHQSAIVLTSREKPKQLAKKEGKMLPIRSLQLTGLPTAEAQKIFCAIGSFWGSPSEWEMLISHYGGNPLALKMVAPALRDFFNSKVSKLLEFLKVGTLVFDDIRNLLERQFNRLSELETEVMYWLVIHQEPVLFLELQEDLVPAVSSGELLETLASLLRRSLIEKNPDGFTQQPAVMQYMTEKLIEQACEEIKTQEFALIRSHTLIKSQRQDSVRDTAIRLILKPITDRLLLTFKSNKSLENHLTQILFKLQSESSEETRYAGDNVLNLLRQVQTDFSSYDGSGLTVWQAYLKGVS